MAHIDAFLQIFQLKGEEALSERVEVGLIHLAIMGGTDNSDLKRIHVMQSFSGC